MDHQNMSEHVLCMVLYLIELGLDNQVQDNKEDEVRYGSCSCGQSSCCLDYKPASYKMCILCFQEPCIEEHCHDSWFPGTNLLSNLHHVINFVRVRVPETAPEVKREAPPSTSTEASSYGQVYVTLIKTTVRETCSDYSSSVCY